MCPFGGTYGYKISVTEIITHFLKSCCCFLANYHEFLSWHPATATLQSTEMAYTTTLINPEEKKKKNCCGT